MKRVSLSYFLPFVATLLITAALNANPAQAQATRTWVSGVGDDANPCSRTAPCKTFAGAISKTAAAGIINCIDPGGFGALTITKSITVDCEATFGGVLAAGTNGINVNGAGVIVNLRNLSIEGVGTGSIGVNFINGASLSIENCKIFGFKGGSAIGIRFAPPTGVGAKLFVSDTTISDNGNAGTNGGILIQPISTGSANVVLNRVQVINNTAGITVNGTGATGGINTQVRESNVSGNGQNGVTAISPAGGSPIDVMIEESTIVSNAGVGVNANGSAASGAGSATVRIGGSAISSNATGVSATGLGVLLSYKTNFIDANGAGNGPITALALN